MKAEILEDRIIVGEVVVDNSILTILEGFQESESSGAKNDIEALRLVQEELFEASSDRDPSECVHIMELLRRVHYIIGKISTLGVIK